MESYSSMDYYSEFKNYAMKHMGISSMQLHYWDKMQENLYSNVQVQGNLTPMILEEREMRVTMMSMRGRTRLTTLLRTREFR